MRTRFLAVWAAAGMAWLAAGSAVAGLDAPAVAPGPARERSPVLRQVLDEAYEAALRYDPITATLRGDERFNDRWPDVSPEGLARQREEARGLLARLRAIDPDSLNEDDRVDFGLLDLLITRILEAERFHPEQIPLGNQNGPQVDLPQLPERLRFATEKHYADYATRLERLPALIDQNIAQMRAGLAAGRVPPRVSVVATPDQAAAVGGERVAADPESSPFFQPFLGRAAADPHAARARKAIREGVAPAYARLATFLREEYLPKCRETVAASESVDGPAYYDFLLRQETTTDLSAEQIHATGLSEVARIRGEMFAVIQKTDWPGKADYPADSDELFSAFVRYLRTEPKFYHRSAEDLLAGYRAIAKRVDPNLIRLFGRIPRNPYGVRPLPAFVAASAPTAFYYPGSYKGGTAGYFMANTYALDQRPKYEMIPLTLHEAVPGHHFERSITDELEGQHIFRQLLGFTVFVEGWGLYAERLGLEMDGAPIRREADGTGGGTGLYTDPYDDFGRLSFEQWRACRLVVDTGLHAKGWSRDRAIAFMARNSAASEHNIVTEVDRYIAWPGQATAYKIGELKIRALRAKAESTLGDRFDLRAFHDEVLGAGPLPLKVLEERMNRWIERGGR